MARVEFANPYHDDRGRFAERGGGAVSTGVGGSDRGLSAGRVAEAQAQPGPRLVAKNVDEALRLLAQGKPVELRHLREVSVLLDKVQELVADARERGDKAPNINLCGVTITGTSLFCGAHKGLSRLEMPQLSGLPLPGTKAAALQQDPKFGVDLTSEFRRHLEAKGVNITDSDTPASVLKATQNELNGAKVANIADRLGDLPPQRLFVSRDDYIVDGHHRWAATIGVDYADNHDDGMTVQTAVVDMDIIDLVAEAHAFSKEWGMPVSDVHDSGAASRAAASIRRIEFAADPAPLFLTAEAIENYVAGLVGRVEFANPNHDHRGRFARKGEGRAVPTGGLDGIDMLAPEPPPVVQHVKVSDIAPENNDRKTFDGLDELGDSIKRHGLAQPITVRPRPARMGDGPPYVLVAGERRWRAHQLIGAETIPAIVKNLDDREASMLMLAENTARKDLNPMDEAEGYKTRIEKFGVSVEDLAKEGGVTPHRIKTYLPLTNLAPELKDQVRSGALPFGPAFELINNQGRALDNNRQLLAHRAWAQEGLTVPQLRHVVSRLLDEQNQETMFDAADFMQVEEWTREAKSRRVSKKKIMSTMDELTQALARHEPNHPALLVARRILNPDDEALAASAGDADQTTVALLGELADALAVFEPDNPAVASARTSVALELGDDRVVTAAATIGRVEFANPYHDKRGRFARKDGGRAVPTKGLKLKTSEATRYLAGNAKAAAAHVASIRGLAANPEVLDPLVAVTDEAVKVIGDAEATTADKLYAMVAVSECAKVLVEQAGDDLGDAKADVATMQEDWEADTKRWCDRVTITAQVDQFAAQSDAHADDWKADVEATTAGLGSLEGLEFWKKSRPSLMRKVVDKVANEGRSIDGALADVKDSVRFTVVVPDIDALGGSTFESRKDQWKARMTDLGFEVNDSKPFVTYGSPNPYRGYNLTAFDPTGARLPIEVQFHTEASYAAVKKSHKPYELARVQPAGSPQRATLEAESARYFETVPIPPGVLVRTPQGTQRASFSFEQFADRSVSVAPPPLGSIESNGSLGWRGVLAVEGSRSGDGRSIRPGALTWRELPLPLMAMFRNPDGGEGHAAAAIAGRIDRIWRDAKNPAIIWGEGVYDDGPVGLEARRLLDHKMLRGVSVDLCDVIPEWRSGESSVVSYQAACIMGATQCAFPAFADARLEIADEVLVATAGIGATLWLPYDEPATAIVASAGGIGVGPELPPSAWFAMPENPMQGPVRVSAEGQISGYVAAWGTCHIGFDGRCVDVPRSSCNYAEYRKGEVLCDDGTLVATGPLIVDTVHPDLKMRASDAQAFYAHTGSVAGDVAVYEDGFGIYVAGATRPAATPGQVRALRGGDVSPDWRRVNRRPGLECVAMLAVNNSGFKVPFALAASAGDLIFPGKDAQGRFEIDTGEVITLVSAGRVPRPAGEIDVDVDEMSLTIRADRIRARAAAYLTTIKRVQFANPYHDQRGRFAPKDGGSAVPTKGLDGIDMLTPGAVKERVTADEVPNQGFLAAPVMSQASIDTAETAADDWAGANTKQLTPLIAFGIASGDNWRIRRGFKLDQLDAPVTDTKGDNFTARDFARSIAAMPTADVVTFRGVRGETSDPADTDWAGRVGKVLRFRSPVSSSMDPIRGAGGHASPVASVRHPQSTQSTGTLFEIRGRGTPLGSKAAVGRDHHVVMPPGRYRVKGVRRARVPMGGRREQQKPMLIVELTQEHVDPYESFIESGPALPLVASGGFGDEPPEGWDPFVAEPDEIEWADDDTPSTEDLALLRVQFTSTMRHVQFANPYHDEQGRFAEKDGAAGTGYLDEAGSGLDLLTAGRTDRLSDRYGMTYSDVAARSPEVQWAKNWDGWATVRAVDMPRDTPFVATEKLLVGDAIDRHWGEPVSESYAVQAITDRAGRVVVVDGHHRLAALAGATSIPVRLLNHDDVQRLRESKAAAAVARRDTDLC